MGRRTFGIILGAVSGLLLIGALGYDTTVTTPYGDRVHNVGLMQDQMLFALMGIGGLLGAIYLYFGDRSGGSAQTIAPPVAKQVPTPPQGFSLDLNQALFYTSRPNPTPSVSRVMWTRELEKTANLSAFTKKQLDWAWSNDVAPERVAEFIAYVEAYRSFQYSA